MLKHLNPLRIMFMMFNGIHRILLYLLLLMEKGLKIDLFIFNKRYIDLWDLGDLEEPFIHHKAG